MQVRAKYLRKVVALRATIKHNKDMDTEELIKAQRAAHATWVACPDRNKAEKARLEAALSAASRAVAASKRAANPAQSGPTDAEKRAKFAAAEAARIAREKERADENALNRALNAWDRAQEYPRCGQDWPEYPGERSADAILRAAGMADELGMGVA
jgi:hypothetical protein